MKAGFIKMYKITERQELKLVPNKEHTVEFVGRRIYYGYTEVVINGKKSCVNLKF